MRRSRKKRDGWAMPTYERLPAFLRDFERLTPSQRAAFLAAVAKFVEDLQRGGELRAGLRVGELRTRAKTFEMTWTPDGRATFEYGTPVHAGHVHVIWRRVGTHDIFDRP